MKTLAYVPLVVSSLVAGGVILLVAPAQSAIYRVGFSPSSSVYPVLGNTFGLAGKNGSPVNVISFTSPEFPISQINNNNTPLVNVSIVGGAIPPESSYSFDVNVEDNPDGTSFVQVVNHRQIVATPDGVEERPFIDLTITSGLSPGAGTSFSAFKLTFTGEFNGVPFEFPVIYQLPGDQFTISDASFDAPVTIQVSSQAIPGYVPFEQLNNFSPPTEFTLTPGGSITTTAVSPQVTTPEPSLVASLSVLGFGAFLKRRLFKRR